MPALYKTTDRYGGCQTSETSQTGERKMSDVRYGWRENFSVGDLVEFYGMKGEVVRGSHVNPSQVPVCLGGSACIHDLHCEELTKIKPEPQQHEARIGDPAYVGQWQPTGEKFEVMFELHDVLGSFRIRERKDR
jgi:hypothetical protein